MKHLLFENGFGEVWVDPQTVNKNTFHNSFRRRLNDQHVQNWHSKLNNSSRFSILKLLHQEYSMANYIKKVKNPAARELFTRLRIDMNILLTSKVSGNSDDLECFLCKNDIESVGHFLLDCARYDEIRNNFYTSLETADVRFCELPREEKLRFILNIRCPDEYIGVCCKFLLDMYRQRELDIPLQV